MAEPRGVNELHLRYRRQTGESAWGDVYEIDTDMDMEEQIRRLDYVVWLEDELLNSYKQDINRLIERQEGP
jgi:hypothetical protein